MCCFINQNCRHNSERLFCGPRSFIPNPTVGLIGVIAAHTDISGAEESAGVKTTLVTAGRKKALGNQFAPLGEKGLAEMRGDVDRFYDMFTLAVAKGRGAAAGGVERVWRGRSRGCC